jgi:hypothetical protein
MGKKVSLSATSHTKLITYALEQAVWDIAMQVREKFPLTKDRIIARGRRQMKYTGRSSGAGHMIIGCRQVARSTTANQEERKAMILTDNETKVDLLNNEAIATTIIGLLRAKPDHPVTIGVHGDWGLANRAC